jgi:hypothetical protein
MSKYHFNIYITSDIHRPEPYHNNETLVLGMNFIENARRLNINNKKKEIKKVKVTFFILFILL